MQNFQELNLHKDLNASLAKINFKKPTTVQAKAIPLILNSRDVLGSAHTGTGKTAAFCIPLIEMVLNNKCKRAIILAPTRELAKQIEAVIQTLLVSKSKVKCLSLVGGEPIGKQLNRLRSNPQIIIGTPGRVNDHLNKKSLDLSKANFLILDEMDRMLDMGFSIQIDKILKFIPKEKQTLMFSATISKSIERLSSKYLNNPERVTVEEDKNDIPKIEQKIINLSNDEKLPYLVRHVQEKHGLMLVFVKTKRGAKKLAKQLYKEGFDADAIHGDLRQNKRSAVIKKFRSNKIQVLVATDVAARGLDIPNIEHVINYDLPQQAEDFIHRIGRTGRAGAKGQAWSYVTKSDSRKWREIEKILYPGKKISFNEDRSERPHKGKKHFGNKRKFKSRDRRDKFKEKNQRKKISFNENQDRDERPHGEKKRFKNNRKFKSSDRSDQFKDKNFKEKNQNGFKNKKSRFSKNSKFSKRKKETIKRFNKRNKFKSKKK
ncbi:MAG: DEAD/DEAH box helicase [Pelagibacteraceae bacterium]|nr:DEAD/DEAH box helicase [Pelagibacteraceae bacterium]MCI5079694.1 DEAD/DEAH box helicase [Pelagibacteraceae bacterium]